MNAATETNCYFAKSGLLGSHWRSGWLTRKEALEKARWFVQEWLNCGVRTSAIVFYRDGNAVATVTPDNWNY